MHKELFDKVKFQTWQYFPGAPRTPCHAQGHTRCGLARDRHCARLWCARSAVCTYLTAERSPDTDGPGPGCRENCHYQFCTRSRQGRVQRPFNRTQALAATSSFLPWQSLIRTKNKACVDNINIWRFKPKAIYRRFGIFKIQGSFKSELKKTLLRG